MLLATTGAREARPEEALRAEDLIAAQSLIRRLPVGEAVLDAILRLVRGARPELLSGPEEADLSFRGATTGLDPARGPFLVFDLGGGSTEFAHGTDSVDSALSLEIGCVRLTERFIESDPPRPEELTAAITYAQSWVDDVLRKMPGAAASPTVSPEPEAPASPSVAEWRRTPTRRSSRTTGAWTHPAASSRRRASARGISASSTSPVMASVTRTLPAVRSHCVPPCAESRAVNDSPIRSGVAGSVPRS